MHKKSSVLLKYGTQMRLYLYSLCPGCVCPSGQQIPLLWTDVIHCTVHRGGAHGLLVTVTL